MARPHLSASPAHRPRLVGRLGTAVFLVATASLGLSVLPGTASAAPDSPAQEATSPQQTGSAGEDTQLVADADRELEIITEQVNEAQVVLEEHQAAAALAAEAVASAEAQVTALDPQVRRIARGAFTGSSLSRFNSLMTSSSAEDFLAQVETLDAIAGHTNDILARVAAAAKVAKEAKTTADAAAVVAQQTLNDVTAQQAELSSRIDDYQVQYAQLTAVEQEQVRQEHAGPELPVPTSADAVDSRRAVSGGADPVSAPNEAAQTAVDMALAQVGDPYVWGAGGPDAFDCSGLTQYAYAAAGVSLPHSSKLQSTLGTPVSRADLQPGDLVFFYSPVSHEGMYIGNGQMVHAATFGTPVRVTSVDMKGYVGARRVVG